MWRVIHGGLPRKRHPRVLVVYAGADDLEPPFGCTDEVVETASSRITLLLEFLQHKLPSTVIIYLAVMPHVRFEFGPRTLVLGVSACSGARACILITCISFPCFASAPLTAPVTHI